MYVVLQFHTLLLAIESFEKDDMNNTESEGGLLSPHFPLNFAVNLTLALLT